MLQQEIKCFKALADPMRLRLLQTIHEQNQMCVCVLTERFAVSQSKLSYHLKLLLEAQLISVYASGKWNFYSINMTTLEKIFTQEMLRKLLGSG